MSNGVAGKAIPLLYTNILYLQHTPVGLPTRMFQKDRSLVFYAARQSLDKNFAFAW